MWSLQDECDFKPPHMGEVADYIHKNYPGTYLEELVNQCHSRILSTATIGQQLEDIGNLHYHLHDMLHDEMIVPQLETILRHYRSLSIQSILTGISPMEARTLWLKLQDAEDAKNAEQAEQDAEDAKESLMMSDAIAKAKASS